MNSIFAQGVFRGDLRGCFVRFGGVATGWIDCCTLPSYTTCDLQANALLAPVVIATLPVRSVGGTIKAGKKPPNARSIIENVKPKKYLDLDAMAGDIGRCA